jgi:hypothetical protein
MGSVRFYHDFPSCSRTYVTLDIYHETLEPTLISQTLGVTPDWSQKVGEALRPGKLVNINGWFWGTRGRSASKDMRAHLYVVFKKFDEKKSKLRKLKKMGCQIRIMCFWESATGNGGPVLDHETLTLLAKYPLDLLEYDIWFPSVP